VLEQIKRSRWIIALSNLPRSYMVRQRIG